MNDGKRSDKISIAGDIGSGKSSIGKVLSKRLGYEFYSTGKIQRELSSKYKMTSLELNLYAEKHPEIDQQIDSFLEALNSQDKSTIVDSRLAWYFIENSFKIYLTVDVEIAAERILLDNERISEDINNRLMLKDSIIKRKLSENNRFREKYNINCSDLNNYDLVIDTSFSTQNEVEEIIILCYKLWINSKSFNKYWVSPRLLIPTQKINELASESAFELIKSIREYGFNYDYSILAIKYNNFFFIFNGHKRVSSAIVNNISLIPILIIASDNELIFNDITVDDFIKSSCRRSWIYDWEDCHKFRYLKYPQQCE